MNQDQIKNQLESIFDKYKFTNEQRSKAVLDLIQTGEALVFANLASEMAPDKKVIFEQYLVSTEAPEEKVKKIYAFLTEAVGNAKLNEVRGSVYDKLIADFIAHMNS
jgi:hypothetical protein